MSKHSVDLSASGGSRHSELLGSSIGTGTHSYTCRYFSRSRAVFCCAPLILIIRSSALTTDQWQAYCSSPATMPHHIIPPTVAIPSGFIYRARPRQSNPRGDAASGQRTFWRRPSGIGSPHLSSQGRNPVRNPIRF